MAGVDESEGMYRHVVMFRFRPGVPPEDIAAIEAAFSALPDQIPSIVGYEWGLNVSQEGFDQGFTHCFLVTFKEQADLDAYLPHPAHQAFVERLLPTLDEDGVFVFDYAARHV